MQLPFAVQQASPSGLEHGCNQAIRYGAQTEAAYHRRLSSVIDDRVTASEGKQRVARLRRFGLAGRRWLVPLVH